MHSPRVLGRGQVMPATLTTWLTVREVEVLSLVRRGLGNQEIGSTLGISMRTAKGHVAAILEKLGAADRAEAVSRGFELGIFATSPRRAQGPGARPCCAALTCPRAEKPAA